jgi:hypothetical protein
MSEIKASKKQVKSVMEALFCVGPVVSEGLQAGKKFCTTHGSANDVGYGWSKRGCEEAGRVADAVVLASDFEYAWLTWANTHTASRFPLKKKAMEWGAKIPGLKLQRRIATKWEDVDQ